MRKYGGAMRNKARSTKRPSEHSERLERLVRHLGEDGRHEFRNRLNDFHDPIKNRFEKAHYHLN